MGNYDQMAAAVSELSGGKNVVLLDDIGMPSIYVRIPKGKNSELVSGLSDNVHYPITRAEYEEYQKRMEQEDHRQNRRIEQLEETTKQINALTVSIEKLAQSVESMVREQEAQGKRLVSLESKDGEMWRKVVGYVITAVIGIVLGFAFTQIGM